MHNSKFRPVMEEIFDIDGMLFILNQHQFNRGPHRAGNQGGDGSAGGTHFEMKNEKGIAGHVNQIHENGNGQGNGGIAHHPEERSAAAGKGQEGK